MDVQDQYLVPPEGHTSFASRHFIIQVDTRLIRVEKKTISKDDYNSICHRKGFLYFLYDIFFIRFSSPEEKKTKIE